VHSRPPITLLAVLPLLLLCGCPKPPPGAADPDPASFSPRPPIPADSPLIAYDKLKLGMSSLDISQAYNAPEGKGDGFTRVIEDFGAASNHIIAFTPKEGEPRRRMVLRVYRDELCKLVDRRDGLSRQQADEWFAELKQKYGEELRMTVPEAQWSWGSRDSVLLTFTRDNASETDMSANVVLVHQPGYDASLNYIEAWQKVHPGATAGPGEAPGNAAGTGAGSGI
jgi:hypothetical protein